MTHAQAAHRSRRFRSGAALRALAFVLWPAVAGTALWGQVTVPSFSSFDGTTPGMSTPGAPADAYALSSVESLNLANGHLNITIPLAEITGRGGLKAPLVARQEARWQVIGYPFQYNCQYASGTVVCQQGAGYAVAYTSWAPLDPGYFTGAMIQRSTGDYCDVLQGYPNYWMNTLTRFTFIAPDGTEHDFRDLNTGGRPEPHGPNTGTGPGSGTGYNRGSVFPAFDASGAVFTTAQAVNDFGGQGCGSAPIPAPAGTVTLRDGTRYNVASGVVGSIEDRNGNQLSLVGSTCTTGN